MSASAYGKRLVRYHDLVRDVLATLGTGDGIRWIRDHKALAEKSIADLEQTWALDKYRHEHQVSLPVYSDDGGGEVGA